MAHTAPRSRAHRSIAPISRVPTPSPVRLRHTERIDIDPDFPQVAQHLALSVLGRPLQACADVPDNLAVHLGHKPYRVL